MHALDAIARKRIEQTSQLGKRFTCMHLCIAILGITGLMSLSVSFWIFLKSETRLLDPPKPKLRLALNLEPHPVPVVAPQEGIDGRFSDEHMRSQVESLKRASTIYHDIPVETSCDSPLLRELQTIAPVERLHVECSVIFLPLLCGDIDNRIGTTLEELDTDGTVSGSRFIWVLPEKLPSGPNFDKLVDLTKKSAHYFIFPRDFFPIPHQAVIRSKTAHFWNKDLVDEDLPTSQFCYVSNIHVLAEAVSACCIPVVEFEFIFPMQKWIDWEQLVVHCTSRAEAEVVITNPAEKVISRKTEELKALNGKVHFLTQSEWILYHLSSS